jgi:pimeloyl-ACP methyl ester carboxylesterase
MKGSSENSFSTVGVAQRRDFELDRAGQTQSTRHVGVGLQRSDRAVEARHALFEIIADSNPKSEMHIINEAGHFCYREQPRTFNSIIQAFVDKVADSAQR